MLKRDRFELLSAYLDGEVTSAERRQVEEWLAHDPVVQKLHARLLKLRQGLQSMPVPAPTQSSQQLVDQVMDRLERRSHRRWMWAGSAIAAVFVGAVSGILPLGQSNSPSLQIAQNPPTTHPVESPTVSTVAVSPVAAPEALMIALDRPVIEIPKAVVIPTEQ